MSASQHGSTVVLVRVQPQHVYTTIRLWRYFTSNKCVCAWWNVERAPSPISSVSKTSVTRIFALWIMSPPANNKNAMLLMFYWGTIKAYGCYILQLHVPQCSTQYGIRYTYEHIMCAIYQQQKQPATHVDRLKTIHQCFYNPISMRSWLISIWLQLTAHITVTAVSNNRPSVFQLRHLMRAIMSYLDRPWSPWSASEWGESCTPCRSP